MKHRSIRYIGHQREIHFYITFEHFKSRCVNQGRQTYFRFFLEKRFTVANKIFVCLSSLIFRTCVSALTILNKLKFKTKRIEGILHKESDFPGFKNCLLYDLPDAVFILEITTFRR